MKTTVNVLYVLLLVVTECFSQIDPGARQIALAHSSVSLSDDVFSLFNNPSALSSIKYRKIGFYYSPSPFGMKELSNAYSAYCEPTNYGIIAGGVSIYGYELYKETRFALGYGKTFFGNISIGAAAVYKSITIKNYGSKGCLQFNLGAIMHVNEKLNLGFYVQNITRTSITGEANEMPTVLWLGTDLIFIKDLVFSCAVKKELGFNPSIRLGTEYSLIDFLKLRVGTSNEPNTYSGGLGIIYGIVEFDYAVTSHNALGISHQFGLILNLNK